jgi:hypothetical protein
MPDAPVAAVPPLRRKALHTDHKVDVEAIRLLSGRGTGENERRSYY